MIGPILVFIGVCAIVAIYMAIVHRFLRAAEKEETRTETAEANRRESNAEATPVSSASSRAPQWAH
jgi:hypothetical protein